MMRALLLGLIAILATPLPARADGWIKCSGPDSSCNASGVHSASIGSGLLIIAGVAYGLARRKRR